MRLHANFNSFSNYDKLHTKRNKMYSGVEGTTLYPIKETPHYFVSSSVWAACCDAIRVKKPTELTVNIPVLSEKTTIDFLREHCWEDWIAKEIGDSDISEAIHLLSALFPNKTVVYFYELSSIVYAYYHGTFIAYDKDGSVCEPSKHELKSRKYYTHKYSGRFADNHPPIKDAYEKYIANSDNKDLFKAYHSLAVDYAYENAPLDEVFVAIGAHAVCYPVVFSAGTAAWYKKEHGKDIAYAHAGEIFFVTTDDTIYFEITRHF